MFFRVKLTVGTRSATFGGMIRGRFLKFERWRFLAGFGVALFCCFAAAAQTAPRPVEYGPSLAPQPSASQLHGARQLLHGHVPAVVSRLASTGRLPVTTNLSLSIGLPLRNEAALEELLRQLYDPGSTNFHKFLTPPEFSARFGPTESDYQAVVHFAETNGLAVAGASGNRMVLDVTGSVSDIERAFQITLRTSGTRPSRVISMRRTPSRPCRRICAWPTCGV